MSVPTKIRDIHFGCLGHFIYVPDQEKHGIFEHHPSFEDIRKELEVDGYLRDDCDAFATFCMMMCDEASIPSDLLVCRTENGEGHMICIAEDMWILDNRQRAVWHFNELPYEYIKIGRNNQWHSVQ